MELTKKAENAVLGGALSTFLFATASLLFAPTSAMASEATCCIGTGYHGCLNGAMTCVPNGACDPYESGRCENEGDDNICEWNWCI